MPRKARTEATEPKKGRASWKPSSMLDVVAPIVNHRLRWVSKDPVNIQKKRAEGWAMANEITGAVADHVHPGGVSDGTPLTSIREFREMVLMAIPEELARERDEFYRERTDKQERGIKRRLQEDFDESAKKNGGHRTAPTGTIIID